MAHRQGEIVVLPFPFADRLGEKTRPAVVVSSNTYNASGPDIIVAQLTTRLAVPHRPGDYVIEQWEQAGLRAASLSRARLSTVGSSRVTRVIGRLTRGDLRRVIAELKLVFDFPK
jgi:mRNA interferase MazF